MITLCVSQGFFFITWGVGCPDRLSWLLAGKGMYGGCVHYFGFKWKLPIGWATYSMWEFTFLFMPLVRRIIGKKAISTSFSRNKINTTI
ncbi:hypothetical protein BCR42DRAFT_423232 [Absidia repens]|uniref:Uncharacterized protein n=1 Tax=Absidia repens TaxID=90262 RepID=A0A1X2I5L1_9FUNG|nr:hypothetical protein BCR42DRAFT_423232 [Absidia repens]